MGPALEDADRHLGHAPEGDGVAVAAQVRERDVREDFQHEPAGAQRAGQRVVVVSSGAIVCGLAALGRQGDRPTDPAVLQALSAVGQPRLAQSWQSAFAAHGLLAGQVLLAPLDFGHRQQYLHARGTLHHLLELGVVPVVNENDAVADEEIRFGDNARLAALVAHLVGARLLLLLTDAPGLLTADPRLGVEASLIDEIVEIDERLTGMAGGPGTGGSGGMASKLAAARMASLSGVTTVIGDGRREGVVAGAVAGDPSSRSSGPSRPAGSAPNFPRKLFRLVPTRVPKPSSRAARLSSPTRASRARLWAAVLPKPMPGSTQISATPAAAAVLARSSTNPWTSATTSS